MSHEYVYPTLNWEIWGQRRKLKTMSKEYVYPTLNQSWRDEDQEENCTLQKLCALWACTAVTHFSDIYLPQSGLCAQKDGCAFLAPSEMFTNNLLPLNGPPWATRWTITGSWRLLNGAWQFCLCGSKTIWYKPQPSRRLLRRKHLGFWDFLVGHPQRIFLSKKCQCAVTAAP